MKKSLLKFLPLAVAVLLATSCSKDENNNSENTPVTTEVVNKKEIVQIPFSVGIANANSLSKVAFSENGATINFEEGDVNTVKLTVTGDGVSGELPLVSDGGYKFSGTLSVEADKESAFTTDGIDLQGTFTQNKGDQTSNTSFEELLNHCAHTYNTTFKSTDESLTLIDQNFYVYVERAKEGINIGGQTSFTQNTYYVFPIGTTVEGKTVEAAKLYTIGKAVESVTINGVPTTTKVWGNAAFTLTASVSPSGVTNPNVTWTLTQGSATLTPSGANNSSCSVFIKGNSADLKIKATVDGVESSVVTITVDKNYVDLGTGSVYWKTSDESGTYTFSQAQSKGAPSKDVFDKLWTSSNVTVSGTTFTNNNGSGASITLQNDNYWSGTESKTYYGRNVGVYSGGRNWSRSVKGVDYRVRLVRAQ